MANDAPDDAARERVRRVVTCQRVRPGPQELPAVDHAAHHFTPHHPAPAKLLGVPTSWIERGPGARALAPFGLNDLI